MQLAYIVSAYKNLDQLGRLIRLLASDGSFITVHVDKKTDKRAYAEFATETSNIPSLHLLERHVCHWGGFGHVRATLKGIDQLLRDGITVDYVILLTGQDYPIKPLETIHRFFEQRRGASFMAYSPIPSPSWSPRGGLDRIQYRHLRLYGKHLRLPGKRRFPEGLRPFGGGAYWCLFHECIEAISAFVGERPDVLRFFQHVDIPDEIFFQTVILNSDLAGTVVNDNLRYIDWSRGRRPAILRTGDLEQLKQSSKLFARKFDVTYDRKVLDLIDRELLGHVAVDTATA
jgi:hypothetical protein